MNFQTKLSGKSVILGFEFLSDDFLRGLKTSASVQDCPGLSKDILKTP